MTVITSLAPVRLGTAASAQGQKTDLAPRYGAGTNRSVSLAPTANGVAWLRANEVSGDGRNNVQYTTKSDTKRPREWRKARLTFSPCRVAAPFRVDTGRGRVASVSPQCSIWPVCAYTELNRCPLTSSTHLPSRPSFTVLQTGPCHLSYRVTLSFSGNILNIRSRAQALGLRGKD